MRLYKKYKGISYKSKGEYEIAKFMDDFDLDFEYEFPIAVIDEDKTKIWYPDFYLKEYQVVVEYFGMYNHNEGYREAVEHKKKVFQECGVQFVPIYHINKNWEEYLIKAILMHQEMKAKKINKVLDKYSQKNKSFISKIKGLWKKKD